jgi:hypothetical protein
VSFAAALFGLVALAGLAWMLLGIAGFRRQGVPPLHDTVGVLLLVFASVAGAGAGALVALVVAYRRQKIAEADSAHDRTRVFNERFTAIAAQLGNEQPVVRLAGVHPLLRIKVVPAECPMAGSAWGLTITCAGVYAG